MSCGLFSMFDPVCTLPFLGVGSFKWFLVIPSILVIPFQVGALPCSSEVLKKASFTVFVSNLLPPSLQQVSGVFVTVFVVVFGVNISSLSPLCYAPSAHPGFVLPLSLTLFLPSVLGWVMSKGVRSISAHLLPTGSPSILWGFLVLVETVSLSIRPITLSVRLVANIMAGHIFMEMLAGLIASVPLISFLGIPLFTGLLGFEVAVSLVQALVFTNLLIMFWSEHTEGH